MDWDRFSDEYDPEPDYDRPSTVAEAKADEAGDPWPPAPRCPLGKLVSYHPPIGLPCRCGLILDKEALEAT